MSDQEERPVDLQDLARQCVLGGRSFVEAIDEAERRGATAQELNDAVTAVLADVVAGRRPSCD